MARNNMFPAKAGGTIPPSRFVKLDTSGPNIVVVAGSGDTAVGISQAGQKRAPGLAGSSNVIAAESGDQIQLWGMGDVCLLQADGVGFTEGDPIKSGALGVGTTATGTDIVNARAIQTAAANAFALVQIVPAVPLA